MHDMLIKYTTKEDDKILGLLKGLTKKDSDVFYLFVNGMPLKEIATNLGISYDNVTSKLETIRIRMNADSSFALLTLCLPAMIRKECQDEANLELEVGYLLLDKKGKLV